MESAPQNPPDSETRQGVAERLASRKEHKPLTFTSEDIDVVREQVDALTQQGRTDLPTYYYLNTKRRIMDEAVWNEAQITPDEILGNLARALYDAKSYEEAHRE